MEESRESKIDLLRGIEEQKKNLHQQVQYLRNSITTRENEIVQSLNQVYIDYELECEKLDALVNLKNFTMESKDLGKGYYQENMIETQTKIEQIKSNLGGHKTLFPGNVFGAQIFCDRVKFEIMLHENLHLKLPCEPVYKNMNDIVWERIKEGSLRTQLNAPSSIDIDKTNNYVYITDTLNSRIQIFTENGDHYFSLVLPKAFCPLKVRIISSAVYIYGEGDSKYYLAVCKRTFGSVPDNNGFESFEEVMELASFDVSDFSKHKGTVLTAGPPEFFPNVKCYGCLANDSQVVLELNLHTGGTSGGTGGAFCGTGGTFGGAGGAFGGTGGTFGGAGGTFGGTGGAFGGTGGAFGGTGGTFGGTGGTFGGAGGTLGGTGGAFCGTGFGTTSVHTTQGTSLFGMTPVPTMQGISFGTTSVHTTQGTSLFGMTPVPTMQGISFGTTSVPTTQGTSLFATTSVPTTQGSSLFATTSVPITQGISFGMAPVPITQGTSLFGTTSVPTTQVTSSFPPPPASLFPVASRSLFDSDQRKRFIYLKSIYFEDNTEAIDIQTLRSLNNNTLLYILYKNCSFAVLVFNKQGVCLKGIVELELIKVPFAFSIDAYCNVIILNGEVAKSACNKLKLDTDGDKTCVISIFSSEGIELLHSMTLHEDLEGKAGICVDANFNIVLLLSEGSSEGGMIRKY